MARRCLNFDEAHTVYDVLIQLAGASRDQQARGDFVREVWGEEATREYRFQGHLGFGGKYWPLDNRVTCYPEDRTPEREEILSKTNAELSRMSFDSKTTEKPEQSTVIELLGKVGVADHVQSCVVQYLKESACGSVNYSTVQFVPWIARLIVKIDELQQKVRQAT